MASLITVRLYNEDWTPKTWASPKLSAIREKDNVKVIDSKDMIEVWEWFYKYNFSKYSKQELYFFYIDNEQYDDINKLDSYWNKNTWWRDNSIIIDEDRLAKNIWNAKASENNKEWTMGAVVQKATSFVDIILEINKIQSQVSDIAKMLVKEMKVNMDFSLKREIWKIKIPDNQVYYDKIEDIVDSKVDSVVDTIMNWAKDLVKESLDEYENKDEYKESYDDSEIKDVIYWVIWILEWLSNSILSLNQWIEWMTNKDLKDWVIAIDFSWFIDKMKEKDIEKIESLWIKVGEDINVVKKGIMNLSAKLDK